jgi:hypothetical protein
MGCFAEFKLQALASCQNDSSAMIGIAPLALLGGAINLLFIPLVALDHYVIESDLLKKIKTIGTTENRDRANATTSATPQSADRASAVQEGIIAINKLREKALQQVL